MVRFVSLRVQLEDLGLLDIFTQVFSTQMALLRLSANIPYVGTQKDILGLKFAKTL